MDLVCFTVYINILCMNNHNCDTNTANQYYVPGIISINLYDYMNGLLVCYILRIYVD